MRQGAGGDVSGASFDKDVNPIGSGPYLLDLFNLNYLLSGPISKYKVTASYDLNLWIRGRHKHSVHNNGVKISIFILQRKNL